MGFYGPSGGTGGQYDTQGFQTPTIYPSRIRIWGATYVHAIEFTDSNGQTHTFGNTTTAPITTDVTLQAGEYITAVQGTCGVYVNSIQIYTSANREIVGGTWDGGATQYNYDAQPGGGITGFWGRTGWWIDAIGVFVWP